MSNTELHEKIADASKTIFSYCMAKTANREDAEDLSQDILTEIIKSAENLRDDRAFYAFMWSVAGNVYKQWYRKKLRDRTCELPEEIPAEEETAKENDDIYLLRRELTLLSEKYRRATILYYIDGRSCREIAQTLTISESMVKYLLFKSRNILKEGMSMERTLGELSYNPKTLIPLYHGEGPNCFCSFMESKIKQNIISACYNDALTVQQISLETGIPLPYLDDEIKELECKQILVKDGQRYKTNIIIVTSACADEIRRALTKYHTCIADKMEAFLSDAMEQYKEIGFAGCQFSENTLRWQLMAVLARTACGLTSDSNDAPQTAWGEKAFLWCVEQFDTRHAFNYCRVENQKGDRLDFFDYLGAVTRKGDHMDFYGNQRYVRLFCDICRGEKTVYSEYDLESIAQMIKKGYVIKEGENFRPTIPVYTEEQYDKVIALAKEFVQKELADIIYAMDVDSEKILAAHTPKHLQEQVKGVSATDKFINAVGIPVSILEERRMLSTDWHPLEMPTTYAVLK